MSFFLNISLEEFSLFYILTVNLTLFLTALFQKESKIVIFIMSIVLTLDGTSVHVAHALKKIGLFGKKNPICDCSRTNQKP